MKNVRRDTLFILQISQEDKAKSGSSNSVQDYMFTVLKELSVKKEKINELGKFTCLMERALSST